jgi:hypothetical protein
MPEMPAGVDPDIFEDLHISIQGLHLSQVLQRPAELWEMVQLVRSERAMVRGEIYRYDGLREAYRAAGIARTIIQRLDAIRERTGPMIQSLRQFLGGIESVPADDEMKELVVAFIMISQKGREAVAKWIADPPGQKPEAVGKIRVISGIVENYQKALREWRPVPPPPSSPLDKENRPQLTPRFQPLEKPVTGPLFPGLAPGNGMPAPAPAVPPPAPADKPAPVAADVKPEPAKAAAAVAVAAPAAEKPPAPKPAAAAEGLPSDVAAPPASLILPRGVNPEILADVRRVDQCRKIFEETHQEIEVWEVFCLVMLDADPTRVAVERLLLQKKKGERQAFMDGALALFENLLKIRAQYGKFVRDLRGYLATLPVGSFGKETMEMALGFVVASMRGRERAQLWLAEPQRYKQEAAGRLEDIISRTMNYQTALRMLYTDGS